MKLTSKQIVVLNYIKEFSASYGYSPTIREICSGLALKSPATVHDHLKRLVNAGVISMNPNKSRTIELLVENEYANQNVATVKIPVLTEEFLNEMSRTFLEIPVYLLNGYDLKNLCAYKKTSKEIYIVNKSLKPLKDSLVVILKDKKLTVEKGKQDDIIGTVISKMELY